MGGGGIGRGMERRHARASAPGPHRLGARNAPLPLPAGAQPRSQLRCSSICLVIASGRPLGNFPASRATSDRDRRTYDCTGDSAGTKLRRRRNRFPVALHYSLTTCKDVLSRWESVQHLTTGNQDFKDGSRLISDDFNTFCSNLSKFMDVFIAVRRSPGTLT